MTIIGFANDFNSEVVAAVDPGIDGALICLNRTTGAVVDLIPMPILKTQRAGRTKSGKKGEKRQVDGLAVRNWLLEHRPGHFVIEQQGARPAQGLASTATTMRQFGLLEGIAVGLGLGYTLIAPGHWRAACKAPVGKEGSVIACGRLAPQVRTEIDRRLKDKEHRIAGADAWGMAHAWEMDNKPERPKSRRADKETALSNEDFFA